MSSIELNLDIKDFSDIHSSTVNNKFTLEDKTKLSIIKDLWALNWQIEVNDGQIKATPPNAYNKETIRQSMSIKRKEILKKEQEWIRRNSKTSLSLLADGNSVLKSEIQPIIEICTNEKQHRIFRFFRYYWSSPYSEYVGRRIRLLIRDAGIPGKPLIGIAALGSSIIHIPERDEFIGWDKETRTDNIISAMDAYVVGALPPYNYLLGGKLISYVLASNEIREIFQNKYSGKKTIINQRESNDLVCLFTTGLYGHSSQYNRLKYQGKLLYQRIGNTKGYGTLHISEETIRLMKELAVKKEINVGYKFGDGPSWRMRLVRSIGDELKFDSDLLLKHSFSRSIYYIPLADNSIDVLNGKTAKPEYHDYPLSELVDFWKERWLSKRKMHSEVIRNVRQFDPTKFRYWEC